MTAQLAMLALGAGAAFLLGLAVSAVYIALPRPQDRGGFIVERDR